MKPCTVFQEVNPTLQVFVTFSDMSIFINLTGLKLS